MGHTNTIEAQLLFAHLGSRMVAFDLFGRFVPPLRLRAVSDGLAFPPT